MSRPAAVQPDYPLARLTTVRTGGPAEFFARAGSAEALEELLGWANQAELEVGVVARGRTCWWRTRVSADWS